MRRRAGVFGGSFNPVHVGHLILANHLMTEQNLDYMLLVLSPQNPLKCHPEELVDDRIRMEMLRLAVSDAPRLVASDIELTMPRPSYTIHTLDRLRSLHPDTDFTVVVGADNWEIFDKWKDHDRILDEYGVIVYPRPGHELVKKPLPNVTYSESPLLEISSTEVRNMIKRGESPKFLVTEPVYSFIREHHLYEK